jgi:peptidyl-prolyl cis-trans isomerase A (cyclophilin A)
MMNRRTTSFALAAAFGVMTLGGAQAQQPEATAAEPVAPPAPPPAPAFKTARVTLQTSAGTVVVAVETERAPATAANFLRYVTEKRLDGTVFYRALNLAPGIGLIQGGVRGDTKRSLKPIAHEPTSKTGLKNVAGAISMARLTPGTARADFFILTADIPGFDAGGPGGDADGFAAFGRVTEGMDVVKAIYAAPTSATNGEGVMKGQMLDPPIKIVKVTRVR